MGNNRADMQTTYDLREAYVARAGAALAVAGDWEMLGAFTPTPEGYHFTKRGFPDKRYANYLEVAAFHDAELEERARLIEAAADKAEEQLTGLVPPDLEANTDSSNSPTEATQERKEALDE